MKKYLHIYKSELMSNLQYMLNIVFRFSFANFYLYESLGLYL